MAAFILEHLDQPLSVERLAQQVGMSPRTLNRWCEGELGESPAALVRRVRLEEAQRLLEQTSMPLKEIASRTLIGDSSTLWRVSPASSVSLPRNIERALLPACARGSQWPADPALALECQAVLEQR